MSLERAAMGLRVMGAERMQLRFFGGAGTVSGARVLVEHDGRRLLVDCGLFQGLKHFRLRNRSALPVPSTSIEAVVLTHAHIGHSGFLPCLVEMGFAGPVYATQATADLCQLLLPETGRLNEAEAYMANQRGYTRHKPALPLFTEDAALRALDRLEVRPFDVGFDTAAGFACRLQPAGHVLGAASVHLQCGAHSVLYSGDLGSGDDPVLHPPVPPEGADFVLLESTCGRREHRLADTLTRLAKLLSRTAARGGVVLMLTHAAGQAQMLLCVLQRLKRTARIADLPLHLDSAIAEAATVLYAQHTGEHRLSADECVSLLAGVSVARTEDESLALSHLGQPGIIIAADGETEGPRMAQHLKAYAGDERHTIVFAGQPPAGSRGAALLAGAQRVKIQGEWLRLRAEVVALDGLSGHADRKALLDWVLALPRAPQQVYLMHGEPEAADSLRQALGERCDWPCSVPESMDLVNV